MEKRVDDLQWQCGQKANELARVLKEGEHDRNRVSELEQLLSEAKSDLEHQNRQLTLEQQLRQRAGELENQLRQKAAELDHQLRRKITELGSERADTRKERDNKSSELESQLRRKTAELEHKTRNFEADTRALEQQLHRKTQELEERERLYSHGTKEMEARLNEREKLADDLRERVEQCEQLLAEREEHTADELANLRQTVQRLRAELHLGEEYYFTILLHFFIINISRRF